MSIRDGVRAGVVRAGLAAALAASGPVRSAPSGCPVHVLTCAADVGRAIVAVKSLLSVAACAERESVLSPHMWSDGSLTPRHERLIRRHLPDVHLVSSDVIEDALATLRRSAPDLARIASSRRIYLKLAQVALEPCCRAAKSVVMDSDYLWYARPDLLLSWIASSDDRILYNAELDRRRPGDPLRGGIYLPFVEHPDGSRTGMYAPEVVAALGGMLGEHVGYARHFNAGLIAWPRHAMDLAFMERLAGAATELGFGPDAGGASFLDQALLAFAAGRWPRHEPLPAEYYCYSRPRPDQLIARHFIGPISSSPRSYLLPALRLTVNRPSRVA